jgi:hypothetical protein
MIIDPNDKDNSDSIQTQTELTTNWFDSMAHEANVEAFANFKIVFLQNKEEIAIDNIKEINELEPTQSSETPSGGNHTQLEAIEFGKRGQIESEFRTLSMVSTFFKDIKEAIYPAPKNIISNINDQTKPILSVFHVELDANEHVIKITFKLEGTIQESLELHYNLKPSENNQITVDTELDPEIKIESVTFYPSSDQIQIVTVNLPIPASRISDLSDPAIINVEVPHDIKIEATPTVLEDQSHSDTEYIPPTITINDAQSSEGEFAIFNIYLDKPATTVITIDFVTKAGTAISGGSGLLGENDYTSNSGTITILPGQTHVTLNIQILDDAIYEGNESFIVQFSHIEGGNGATLATTQVQAIILDNEVAPIVSVADTTVSEDGTLQVQVSLSGTAQDDITITYQTVNGNAISGIDYTAIQGTLVIPAGQTIGFITIPVIDDTAWEDNEQFTFQIIGVQGANATLGQSEATLTIIDNDDNSPIALGEEHTLQEPVANGPSVEISGDLFSHDDPGNHGGAVSGFKLAFTSAEDANQYIATHQELVGALANGQVVEIPITNSTITTVQGGTLTIQADGNYTYTAPSEGVTMDSDDIITYVLTDLDGDTSEAALNFHIIDQQPIGNDDVGYIAKESINYNLVLTIDVSGSMNDMINGQTRLQIAKNALIELINNYDGIANGLQVTIVPFASGNANSGAFSYTTNDVQDAINYVNKQGSHQTDGVAIGMINPDTNQALQTGTEYNDALYHVREQLQADMADPLLQNYESRVYFLSDGKPTTGHSATDTSNWPSNWGSWQNFINQNTIQTYAISIAAGSDVALALQPVANHANEVIDVNSDLSNLSTVMLITVPQNPLIDNVLNNDILNDGGGHIVSLAFETLDANQYIQDNHLGSLAAFADPDGKTVHIPIPDNSEISFTTPLGSLFTMNTNGNYQYDAKPVGQDEFENFTYTIKENNSNQTSQATLTINVLNDENDLHNLVGDSNDNTISAADLHGIIVMSGKEGNDNFIIDTSPNAQNNVIIIKDLSDHTNNTLTFINAQDKDHNETLNFDDIIHSVSQNGENANVIVTLNNGITPDHSDGTTIIFENIGTLPSNDIASLQEHLAQLTAQLNVIN